MNTLKISTVGWTISGLLAISYVLCVIWDAILPGLAMYPVWELLLPGFSWTATGLIIGFVEAFVYGFYIAVIVVPLFNFLLRRQMAATH